MKNFFFLFNFCLLIIFSSINAQSGDNNFTKGLNSIHPMDPYNYCKEISSEKYEGRLTGDEGYTKAAQWAAGKFKEWNLKPIDNSNGYLQPYPSPYTVIEEAEMKLILPSGEEKNLIPVDEFFPILYSDSGNNTTEVVFVGWGISAPEINYDDYKGFDVNNKFVLCFRGTPDRSNDAFTNHDQHRTRMNNAAEKGALGLIYIYPEVNANPNGEFIPGFTPAEISEKAADALFEEINLTAAEVKKKLLDTKETFSFPLKSKISYSVTSSHHPEGVGYNIVGYVEGSDPELKKECVIVGGHFDHCGKHLGISFNGAQDNASGSATVMEIAEAFSKLDTPLKRSVLFVLFGGEELGLEGSTFFAENLPAQFDKIDAMFNYDMTGEGDGANFGYTPDPPEFHSTLLEADKMVNTLRREWKIEKIGVRSSDFAPFFTKGAACAAFFSNGPHLHYHLPGDTIYRINPDILADIAKVGFISAYKWADR